jgi:hypothetical protein
VSDAIARQTGINVYAVRHPRQSSQQGCKVDALIFGRDCTGKLRGNYIIPNLLTKLHNRATKDAIQSYSVKLPDKLLKTSQISSFTHFHRENAKPIIHKNEALTEFMSRYSDKSVIIKKENKGKIKKESAPAYLRLKGLQLGKVVEYQFYINQW